MKNAVEKSNLYIAAESGDLDSVKQIVRASTVAIDLPSRIGDAPLHASILQQHPNVCKFLLANGADPKLKGNHGNTPLHYAAKVGSIKMIALLLKAGADRDATNVHGQTPYEISVANATDSDQMKISKLLKSGNAISNLRSYISKGQVSSALKAIGNTPALASSTSAAEILLLAVFHQPEAHTNEIVEAILNLGVNPNILSSTWTELPISYAMEPQLAELLLMHGANPNVTNAAGFTPLQVARKYKLKSLEKVLLKYGATIRPSSSASSNNIAISKKRANKDRRPPT